MLHQMTKENFEYNIELLYILLKKIQLYKSLFYIDKIN